MLRLLTFLMLALTLQGCIKLEDVQRTADRMMFSRVGGTLFSSPDEVSMKEIHLDATAVQGHELILEGDLAEVGEHGTYMVLKDETARMLVVLTDVAPDEVAPSKKDGPLRLKVWGTLQMGMKGLPYVMARAMTTVVASANDTPKAH